MGVQTPNQRSSAWPELPADFGCPGKVWDRNIADYVPTYNSQISENMHLFEDIRYNDLKAVFLKIRIQFLKNSAYPHAYPYTTDTLIYEKFRNILYNF